ncbi:MAG: PQQ-dependent sugar dehydrogenase, partial [Myxococcales bacterium]|nr:PQQ-dependent sugar dehydrogenase [Myxococcales bacterium]
MRNGIWIAALAACKGEPGLPTLPTTVVEAEYGYDARPENPDCVAPPERFSVEASIEVNRVFASVSMLNPVALLQAPGDGSAWYFIEQAGRVKRFVPTDATPTAELVLDLRDRIDAGGERGLLGFAFHPSFATNGEVWVSYTNLAGDSVLASVQTSQGGRVWDATSVEEVLTIQQPFPNHNGGDVDFGPDGKLYWALGDGGSGGDPGNRAQNLDVLLGKILRLDVDGPNPYDIPPDNPFVGTGHREEIYAYGLRNPFRMSFDSVTGELWAGDVGQNAVEEVDRIEAGGNYGWRIKEGDTCYATTPCDGDGLIDPVVAYPQDPGYSVIGGRVYRGSAIPELYGRYLFSDYYHGRIVAIVYDDLGVPRRQRLADTFRPIVDFAEDADGEMYVLDRDGGRIYQLQPGLAPTPSTFPQTLSATGCFESADPSRAVEGLLPFDVNHPFWSDGAQKRRWLAIPDGTTLTVDADGDLGFPVGTVLAKEMSLNGQRVETRLFMHHSEDVWAGYAYRWREDGSDADLILSNETVDAAGTPWEIPGPEACMQCHTAAAGRSLGLELGQLDRDAEYPLTGRRAPQLDTLEHIGMFAEPLPDRTAFPALDSDAPVADRARAYLHVNCSQCHRPDGPGRGELDLRISTPFADMGICGPPVHGDLGLTDALVVVPGSPETSVMAARLRDPG